MSSGQPRNRNLRAVKNRILFLLILGILISPLLVYPEQELGLITSTSEETSEIGPDYEISVSNGERRITIQRQTTTQQSVVSESAESDERRSGFGFDAADFNATVESEIVTNDPFRFQYNETFTKTVTQLNNKSTFTVDPIINGYNELDVDVDAYTLKNQYEVEVSGTNGITFNPGVYVAQAFILDDMTLTGTKATIYDFSVDVLFGSSRDNMIINGQIWNATVSGGIVKPDKMLVSDTLTGTTTSDTSYSFNFSSPVELTSSNTFANSTGGYAFLVLYRTDGGAVTLLDSKSDTSNDGGSFLNSTGLPTIPGHWGDDTENDLTSKFTVSYEYDPNSIQTYIDPAPEGSRQLLGAGGIYNETTTYSTSTAYNVTFNGVIPSSSTPLFNVTYSSLEYFLNSTTSASHISDPLQANTQWKLYFNSNWAADVNSTKYFIVPKNFTAFSLYNQTNLQVLDTDYSILQLNTTHQAISIAATKGIGNYTLLANSTNLFRLGTVNTYTNFGSGFGLNTTAMMGILTGGSTPGDTVKANMTVAGLGITNGIVNASLRTPTGGIVGVEYDEQYAWNTSLHFQTTLDSNIATGTWSFQFRWSNGTAAAGISIEFNVVPHTVQQVISHSASFNALEDSLVTVEVATKDLSHDGNWTDASSLQWDFGTQIMAYNRNNASNFFIYSTTLNLTKSINNVNTQSYTLTITLSESRYSVQLSLTMTVYYVGDSDLVLPTSVEYGSNFDFDFFPLDVTNGNTTFDTSDTVGLQLDYLNPSEGYTLTSPTNYTETYDGTAFSYNFTVNWDSRFIRQSNNQFTLTWTLANYRASADVTSIQIAFNITVVDSTAPTIQGPVDLTLNEEQTVNYVFQWAVSDSFTGNYTVLEAGANVKVGDWSNGVNVTFDLASGRQLGSYVFELRAEDDDANQNSFSFTLTVIDVVAPSLDLSPGNNTVSIANNLAFIEWNFTDNHPNLFTLRIDDVISQTGNWNNSGRIRFNIALVADATYKYELQVNDTSGNQVIDTIYLFIDRTQPEISQKSPNLSSITYELGSTGNWINWTLTDSNPANFTVQYQGSTLNNGTALFQIAYSAGTLVSIDIDGRDLGNHNYTLIILDTFGNQRIDTVIVTVEDTTAPSIYSSSGNQTLEQNGTNGYQVTATASDLKDFTYVIFYNSTTEPTEIQVVSPNNWDTDSQISYTIPSQRDLGTHYYRIVFSDTSGNTAQILIVLIVIDTELPTISDAVGNTFEADSTAVVALSWTINDEHAANYTIFVNDAPSTTGTWTDGVPVTLDFSRFQLGTFNITILAQDTSNNRVSDQVQVIIQDTQAPIVTYQGQTTYEAANSGQSISWNVVDLFPSLYVITVDGLFNASNTWTNDTSVGINLNLLALGSYDIEIRVNDTTNNVTVDSFTLVIEDTTNPSIDSVSSFTINEFDTGISVEFTVNDLFPGVFNFTQNGTPLNTNDAWTDGQVISLLLDSLAIGVYTFNITIVDATGLRNTAETVVTIVDTTAPDLNTIDDFVFGFNDTAPHILTWSPGDSNPATYELYLNGVLNGSGAWNNATDIIRDVGDYGVLAEYNFTIIVVDTSGNSVTDTVLFEVFDTTLPQILSQQPAGNSYTYELASTGNIFNFTISEQFPTNYSVLLDNAIYANLNQTTYLDGQTLSINVDGLGVGEYNFTIVIRDEENNSITSEITITVEDTTSPSIPTTSGDDTIEQGSTIGYEISWTATDASGSGNYSITRDGSALTSGLWTSTVAVTVIVAVDFEIGDHVYVITFEDENGNDASNTVTLTIVDTRSPDLTVETDRAFELTNTTLTHILSWDAGDRNPGTFTILVNDNSVALDVWDNSTAIVLDISLFEVGEYTVVIQVRDSSDNIATDEIQVVVTDTTAPTMTDLVDFRIFTNQTAVLNWEVYDLDPSNYSLFLNGTLAQVGDWTSGANISINLGFLGTGVYNYALDVLDKSGNSNRDTLTVTVKPAGVVETAAVQYSEISLEVYEGDQDRITGNWTELLTPRGVPNGDIHFSLISRGVDGFQFNEIILDFAFNSSTFDNGTFVFSIDYTSIPEGSFGWIIDFTKEGYESKRIETEFEVLAHTIAITIEFPSTLVQNAEYQIVAYLNYTTFDNESGLSLSLINQRRSGGVEGVNVNFIVNYLTTEGASGSIPGTANSNQDGVALFTLTPSQTSGISSIEGISVSVDNPSISTQSLTISDPEDLPAIEVAVVGVNDIVTIISSFVQE
ncbi:MAG: beta strand repeat-containing protein, partial [Candidatus Kariarchaeaceae archaeon]